jgi:hypothetical protein
VSRPRSEDPLDVLREIWRATGQSAADVEEACGPQKACKSMSAVGFDGWAEAGDGRGDLRAAWRAQLEREGKLRPGTGSVRDLVLGPGD